MQLNSAAKVLRISHQYGCSKFPETPVDCLNRISALHGNFIPYDFSVGWAMADQGGQEQVVLVSILNIGILKPE